jgi:hypothetical protein
MAIVFYLPSFGGQIERFSNGNAAQSGVVHGGIGDNITTSIGDCLAP